MLKSCKYCGRIHDSKHDCGKKPKRIKAGNDKDKFRWSSVWRTKRDEIKERDQYLCQLCKRQGRYIHDHLEVHHIVPLEENFDIRLDNDNLITLCEQHHEAAERGEITKDFLMSIVNK